MRAQIGFFLAAASAVAAQSPAVVAPAPVVSGNPRGASYIATLPEQQKYTVRGSVAAVSAEDGNGVKFTVSVSGLPAEGGPFMYHLHEKPVPSDGNCTGTGAHLDPYKRGEITLCDASKPETCQTGDLSGKFGNITAQEWSQEYIDLYSATRPDINSYFGNLSVVVHLSNKTRISCANFTQLSPGEEPSYPVSSIILSTGVSSGYAQPTGSGHYNSSLPATPTGTASPTTGVPISPSSASPSAPLFTDAAPKLVGGAAGAVVAVAAVLLL